MSNGTMAGLGDLRPALHYLAAAVVMPVYGIQVCPFIESLTYIQVTLPIVAALALQYLLRVPLRAALVGRASLEERVRRTFLVELLLFLVSALALALFNGVVHGFPWDSGAKLFLGLASLGLFAAIDLSLKQERELADFAGEAMLDPRQGYFPLSRKFAIFASGCAVLVLAIILLLINKDLDWIVQVGGEVPLEEARRAILIEFIFVLAVVVPHVVNVIVSYSMNLGHFFDHQNRVLGEVSRGTLTGVVPVSTKDEFGVMARLTNRMVGSLRESTEEVQRTRDVTIFTLASLAETRDNETGAHILRTQRYVHALARQLRDHPHFRDTLDEETIELLFKSAPLHDIGKVGIPDRILLKPGKLTPEEFEIMKTHAMLGAEALHVAEAELGSNSFLRLATEIAANHHEKWDGSGYPEGIQGDRIPVSGRLMAVADVYDALICKRVYKPAFSHQKAAAIILEGRGKHFDPDVVDAFCAREDEFKDIAAKYRDQE